MSVEAAVAPAERASLAAPALLCALVAAAAAFHLNWPLPGDTSWLITVCERMLAGQALYTDINELNPPMSAWLYMPWVWLAPHIGLSAETLIKLATLATCLGSIVASGRILERAGLVRNQTTWLLVATAALILAPAYTFTQREHFAVAFVLPILACIASRDAGAPARPWAIIVAGVGAGFAVAIKPHFALAILAPVALMVASRRSLKPAFAPECLIGAAVFLAYAVAFLTLYPGYVLDMLPLVTEVYGPNRNPMRILLLAPFTIVAALCLVAWLARDGLDLRPLPRTLLAATVGFFAAYLVQGRGWPYHLMPAFTLAAIGFCLSAFSPGRNEPRNPVRRLLVTVTTALATVGLFVAAVVPVLERERGELAYARAAANALAPLGGGLKIALIGDDLAFASPLHRSIGATLVNRGPALWLAGNALDLYKASGLKEVASWDRALERERAMLAEDLSRDPPDAIIGVVTRNDWLAWAKQDPDLSAFLDQYQPYARIDEPLHPARILVRGERFTPSLKPSLSHASQ